MDKLCFIDLATCPVRYCNDCSKFWAYLREGHCPQCDSTNIEDTDVVKGHQAKICKDCDLVFYLD